MTTPGSQLRMEKAAALKATPSLNALDSNNDTAPRGGPFLHSGLLWQLLLPAAELLLFTGCYFFFYALRVDDTNILHGVWGGLSYAVAVLGTIAVMGGYRRHGIQRRLSFAAEFIMAVIVGSLLGALLLYAGLSASNLVSSESRAVLLLTSAAFAPAALALRFLLLAWRQELDSRRPYVVVGTREQLNTFAQSYQRTGLSNPVHQIELLPHMDAERSSATLSAFLKGGDAANLADFEGIIICETPANLPDHLLQRLVRLHFDALPVFTLDSFYAAMWRQVPTVELEFSWALSQDFSLAERSYYRYVKRTMDLFLSSLLLLACLPLLGAVALLVRLSGTGPILFRQPRVGRGGRVFTLCKFRTMRWSPQQEGSPYTGEKDERVTWIGNFLRRLRLDELPQLINVWRGDMSLIGPRAEWTRLVADYEQRIPCYHLRHLIRPGITGWAQLNHPYGASLEDTVEKLKYDLYYLKHYSPLLDLEIVLKTILSVLSFKGR